MSVIHACLFIHQVCFSFFLATGIYLKQWYTHFYKVFNTPVFSTDEGIHEQMGGWDQ